MLKIEFQIANPDEAQRAARIACFIADDYGADVELRPLPMTVGETLQSDRGVATARAEADTAERRATRRPRAAKAETVDTRPDPAALYVAAAGALPAAPVVASESTTEVAKVAEALSTVAEASTETLVAAVETRAAPSLPATTPPASTAPTAELIDRAKAACAERGALWVREFAKTSGIKSIGECSTAQLEGLIEAAGKVPA